MAIIPISLGADFPIGFGKFIINETMIEPTPTEATVVTNTNSLERIRVYRSYNRIITLGLISDDYDDFYDLDEFYKVTCRNGVDEFSFDQLTEIINSDTDTTDRLYRFVNPPSYTFEENILKVGLVLEVVN